MSFRVASRPSAASFLAALAPELRHQAETMPELSAYLGRLLAEAAAAYPGVAVDDDVFLAHLAARLPPEQPLLAALAGVRAADLRLACACLVGTPSALATFDRHCVAPLGPTLARLAPPGKGEDGEDLAQLLRARLFGLDGSGRRRLAEYAGTGSLRRWVRATAVRLALNERRGAVPEASDDALLIERVADPRDDERAYLEARYRPTFAAAVRASLAALPARDQNLLRQHYVDGLGLDELGALHGVHRATAYRWLERARQSLLSGARSRLRETLGVGSAELDSLLRLFGSRLDLSLGLAP